MFYLGNLGDFLGTCFAIDTVNKRLFIFQDKSEVNRKSMDL